eukprot:Opistho-2@77552
MSDDSGACECSQTALWSADGFCVHPSHAHSWFLLRWRYRLREYILSFDETHTDGDDAAAAEESDEERLRGPVTADARRTGADDVDDDEDAQSVRVSDRAANGRTAGSNGGASSNRPTSVAGHVGDWIRARFAWIVLVAAIFAVSSAATVFKYLGGVGLFTKGAWRLLSTSFILLPCYVYQAAASPRRIRTRMFTAKSMLIQLGGGLVLSLHFATWLYSLEHTSLPHSLLLVCMHPVLIVGAMLLIGVPVGRWEVLGTAISFGGTVLLMRDVESDGEVTLVGDFMALVGAVFMILYLCVGRVLRSWMPIFVYAFPVTCWAGVWLAVMAIAVEGVSVFAAGKDGVFGFFAMDIHTLTPTTTPTTAPTHAPTRTATFRTSHISPSAPASWATPVSTMPYRLWVRWSSRLRC